MKRIFTERGHYTPQGTRAMFEADKVVSHLFRKLVGEGFPVREVASLIQHSVFDSECCAMLEPEKD